MEVIEKTFRDKFNDLTDQMTSLIANASEEELAREGIHLTKVKEIPEIDLEAKTEKDFLVGLLLRTTGKKDSFIFQKSDEVSREELNLMVGKNTTVVTPSVIKSSGIKQTFTPYILYFTPDMKLAMVPYDGKEFSDLKFFSE